MSGHSKWATIHRQKETADQKRGLLFSKLAKAIAIAAREGSDPEANFKLRLVIEKARQANMPKENINRALKRGSGGIGSEKWEEVVYEGYGPKGVGAIVETLTDNKNRTTAEIKNIFERGGGSLASPGAVSFQFKRAGLLTVKRDKAPEGQVLKIIDLGVEDVEEAADAIEVYVRPGELDKARKNLEAHGLSVVSAELVRQPTMMITISEKKDAAKVLGFLNQLEEHDDVQKVFANVDIPDDIAKSALEGIENQ